LLDLVRQKLPYESALRDDVDDAVAAGERMSKLLTEVLEVQRLEAGEFEVHPEPRVLGEVLREVTSVLRGVARTRNVELELHGDVDSEADIDLRLFRRAVENLVANAVRYAPAHSAVEIAVHQDEALSVIEVADRGPGVPDTLKELVFDRLGTVEASSRRARRGYGLGLYLVRLVATIHGGAVDVQDRAGGGSVFHLKVPRHRALHLHA
jgi:two-component system sensor histidine kinase KdpD